MLKTIVPPDDTSYSILCTLVHNRYPILIELYNFVVLQLGDYCSTLEPQQRYRSRDLIGQVCWQQLSRLERMQAGSVISHLALTGQIPLVKQAKRSPWRPNEYVRIDR